MSRFQWINAIVPYNSTTKIAQKKILDNFGQEIVGVYEFCFRSVILKFDETIDTFGMVCCNFLTNFEYSTHGNLERVFAPIKVLSVKAVPGSSQLIELDSTRSYVISDLSDLKIWLQDFRKKRINTDINVHICYRKSSHV